MAPPPPSIIPGKNATQREGLKREEKDYQTEEEDYNVTRLLPGLDHPVEQG
jgi:hypothetical protein